MKRRAGLVVLLGLGAALLATVPAAATLGPIQLVSKSPGEQADEARAPALSADGRYLVFQARIGGRSGVFRENVAGGALEPVATGDAYSGEGPADAEAPSISADGRFVSFTTTARLDPGDDLEEGTSDVYVADLSQSPPAYELASARDGCVPGESPEPCGVAYENGLGSAASGRVALSADGRRVAFVVRSPSNLTSGPGGSTEGVETPGGQVVVRDLDGDRTILVSAVRDLLTGAISEPPLPVPGGAVVDSPALTQLVGAAISADGSTVAWLGGHLPAQVPLLRDEREKVEKLDAIDATPYDEPLWRRVADGSGAPTRRVVGGGDPLAPGCPPQGTLAEAACQGPFPGITFKSDRINSATGWLGLQGVDGVPALSANGDTVALVGNPREAADVFLVNMAPGLDRVQATQQVTRAVPVSPSEEEKVVNQEPFLPLNAHVFDLAVSADGSRVAFVTARQQFPLSPPNLVTPPPAQLGLVELYLADLPAETLRRVSHGSGGEGEASRSPGGNPIDGDGAASPTLSGSGRLLAFASTASNLVEGDGNDASDVFTVADPETPPGSGSVRISAPPGGAVVKRRKRLAVSAFSLPSGAVKLVVVVPAAGRLRAQAQAALAVGGKSRRLSAATGKARRHGPVGLLLKLPPRLRARARSAEGLYATVEVRFLSRENHQQARVGVRFHVHTRARRKERR